MEAEKEKIESKLEVITENHVKFTDAVKNVLRGHVTIEDIASLRRLARRLHLPPVETDVLLSDHEHNWDTLVEEACYNKTHREAQHEVGHLLSLANCLVKHNPISQHESLLQEIIALNIDINDLSTSSSSLAAKLHAYLKLLSSLRHRLSAAIDTHLDTLSGSINARVVVVSDEQQKCQEDVLAKMAELQELMSQRFNTVERKMRSISNQVSASTSSLQALLSGEIDCPHLYIALPASTSTHVLTDTTLRLYPLCAYSYDPVGEGYQLHHTSSHHDQILTLLHISTSILTSIATNPFSSVLMPSLTLSATQFMAQYISSCTASLDKTESEYTSSMPVVASFHAHVATASSLSDALQSLDEDTLHSIQPILGSAYAQIRALLMAQDPGLQALRCLMAPCVNMKGDVAWVKYEHMHAYKYSIAASPSPTKQICDADVYEESSLPEYDPVNHLPHPDPWILVEPVKLSEESSVYVAALCNWLETVVMLTTYDAQEIAVVLVMDGCMHVGMLRDRLKSCGKYLHNIGIAAADEVVIKRAAVEEKSVFSTWFG